MTRFTPRNRRDWRAWLEKNHADESEVWLVFIKKHTKRQNLSYDDAVEEALCFGWIDGIRRSRCEESYVIRFTPRSPKSVWSHRNIERVEALTAEGRIMPAGLAAFAHKDVHPDSGYRTSERPTELPGGMLERLQADPSAWAFFREQPVGYRRQVTRWVLAAKREETRARRLATLIEDSANGLRIRQLRGG